MVVSRVFQCLLLLSIFVIFVDTKINEIKVQGNYSVLSRATLNFISSFFKGTSYLSLTINVAMSNISKFEGSDVGNEIMMGIGMDFRIIVRGHQRKFKDFDKRRSPIVLILDSLDSFNAIKLKLKRIYPKYYLIVLVNGLFKDVDVIVKELWSMSMDNVNFLTGNSTHGIIYTYFPFDHNKCGTDLLLHVINVFDLTTQKWSNSDFYPDKVQNLNNCTLNIGVTESIPMVILSNGTDGTKIFDGIEVLLIQKLAVEFNFTAKFNIFEKVGVAREINSSGVLGSLFHRKCDVAIGSLSLQIDRTEVLSATSMFASIPIVAVIPPSSQISAFVKLYLPFDFPTWILLFATFFIGYAVILISRLISKSMYKFIVGHKVNFPFTNMLIAFFGGSQTTLPKTNFSRFLLGKFLLFCLVIRGLYQGKLFDIMKKNIYEKTPTTFDGLIAKNYIFYTYESLSRRVQGFKFANKVKVIKNSEIEHYRQKTLDSSFNGIVFSYEPQVIYENLMHIKEYSYLILKERFVTNQMVFYLQENHFLADHFSEKIEWFRDFGFTNYIFDEFVDTGHAHFSSNENTSKPLRFAELSAIFTIWIIGLIAAAVICLIEIGIGYKSSFKILKRNPGKKFKPSKVLLNMQKKK